MATHTSQVAVIARWEHQDSLWAQVAISQHGRAAVFRCSANHTDQPHTLVALDAASG